MNNPKDDWRRRSAIAQKKALKATLYVFHRLMGSVAIMVGIITDTPRWIIMGAIVVSICIYQDFFGPS